MTSVHTTEVVEKEEKLTLKLTQNLIHSCYNNYFTLSYMYTLLFNFDVILYVFQIIFSSIIEETIIAIYKVAARM